MTRKESFEKYYMTEQSTAPLFESEYQFLRSLWESIPAEYRERLFQLPDMPELAKPEWLTEDLSQASSEEQEWQAEGLAEHEAKAQNVKAVAQHYRYRMASEFCADMPTIFRQVLMMADDQEMMELLFFGTMGVLSACMPRVHGSLMREEVSPNLYFFITGAAASGKGKIGLSRRLLEQLNKDYLFLGAPFILPANSTDTAFYEALGNNGGRGIIFESEADTLTAAFGKANGKFSDGLRAAFHNEAITYMRRTDNERVLIPHPVLSMVLTGTPRQVSLLLKSPENGLFSRILFYRLMADRESYAEQAEVHRGITGSMVNDYMDCLGHKVREFFLRLEHRSRDIEFSLTEEQEQRFMQYFHDTTIEYKEMFGQCYEGEEAVDHATGIMNRMGNICYRMMMVLGVSRLMYCGEDELPDKVVCHQDDFDRVMEMVPVLLYHNHLHYDEMMVRGGEVPPLEDEDSNTGDMLTEKQREFLEKLPPVFIRQKALQIGEEMSLTARTVSRYLVRLCELGLLIRQRRGSYEKSEAAVDLLSQES